MPRLSGPRNKFSGPLSRDQLLSALASARIAREAIKTVEKGDTHRYLSCRGQVECTELEIAKIGQQLGTKYSVGAFL